jgi:hypothetical protein
VALTRVRVGGEVAAEITAARLSGRRADVRGTVFRTLLQIGLLLSLLVLVVLLVDVLVGGDAWALTGVNVGLFSVDTSREEAAAVVLPPRRPRRPSVHGPASPTLRIWRWH